MDISHHALRCFLNGKQPIRTRERTLAKIEARSAPWVDPPREVILRWLEADLSWLRPPLTAEDANELLGVVRQRVKWREKAV